MTMISLFSILFGIFNLINSQPLIQSSNFLIVENRSYIPSNNYSIIANYTAHSISECATYCLQATLCQTATYNSIANRCCLYNEENSLGSSAYNLNSFLLKLDAPEPCVLPKNVTLLNLFNVTTSAYKFYSFSYQTCARSAKLTFAFQQDIDAWCLDDITVSNGTHNLILNGGFETGNLMPWVYENPRNLSFPGGISQVWSNHNARSGIYFYSDGVYNGFDYLSQNFSTIPMFQYNISFWIDNRVPSNANNLLVRAAVFVTS